MANFFHNNEQAAIINHIFGPVLVLAPVGTGKTNVLAERVRRAIEAGIPAERILCMTFTNRAAGEMAARVRKHYPELAPKLTVKTFHGLCARMLRIEARAVGLSRDFTIFDDTDSMELLKELFGMGEREARYLYFAIERAKTMPLRRNPSRKCERGDPDDQAAAESGLQRQIRLYQRELNKRGALDFADLVCAVREMLNESEEIRARWQSRFDFIQVDEVQDTHISEYEVLTVLAERSRNIALIGDIDQTIYEWRGSEPGAILDLFRREFNPVGFCLTENYRATKTLLGASSAFSESLMDRQTSIRPAESCGVGRPIGVHRAQTEKEEADWIARMIALIPEKERIPYGRIAVLGRTNKRTIVVSRALERRRIPCYTVEAFEFFRRQEVKDALAYLKILDHPEDLAGLKRVLLRSPRGIGEASVRRITEVAQAENGFRELDERPFSREGSGRFHWACF